MITVLGMFVSFHDQTLLFIIMCWLLFIEQWILFTENDKKEGGMKKLLNCTLLIIFSVYAYYNSKQLMFITWISPPWMMYYDLIFILYILSVPSRLTEKTGKKICYILQYRF